MADTGVNIGSFGGGFAKGLANVLYRNQQDQREREMKDRDRRDRLMTAVLPHVIENAEDPGDLEPYLQQAFPDIFGQVGKAPKTRGAKAGQPGPMDHVKTVLSYLKPHFGPGSAIPTPDPGMHTGPTPPIEPIANQVGTPTATPLQVDMTPKPPATTVVPGTGIPVEGTPAAPAAKPRPTLFGVPLITQEEREERNIKQQGASIEAKVRIAQRLYDSGTVKTLDEAFDRVGLYDTRGGSAAYAQSVPGEVNGKPEFGVFDKTTGGYNYPANHPTLAGKPIAGFVPRSSTGATNLGVERESLAREMFGKPASQLTAGEMAQVNAALPGRVGQTAEARGLGSGRARIATELKMPIGPTAAAMFNVPPTTELGQLSQANGLTADQQEKIASLAQVDKAVQDIDALLPKVFPNVQAGVWGRIQTQWQLGMKQLGADEDLAQLDAAINIALADVARLGGQTGVLSNQDVERAQASLATLQPSLFGGDTLATARARLIVVKNLLTLAQSRVPTRTSPGATGARVTAPGAGGGTGTQTAPPNSAAPTAVLKDGKWVLP